MNPRILEPDREITDEELLLYYELEHQYYLEMLREYDYIDPLPLVGSRKVNGGVVHY